MNKVEHSVILHVVPQHGSCITVAMLRDIASGTHCSWHCPRPLRSLNWVMKQGCVNGNLWKELRFILCIHILTTQPFACFYFCMYQVHKHCSWRGS